MNRQERYKLRIPAIIWRIRFFISRIESIYQKKKRGSINKGRQ